MEIVAFGCCFSCDVYVEQKGVSLNRGRFPLSFAPTLTTKLIFAFNNLELRD